ncbi:hypothetical protein ZEAMMB73_Zm00001d042681 [Zea mays]|uniref:Uncharacterized protein n=1 Tax=Zea mays TaxID=4577 RepID=A0A1D6N626_MAIZE|nr:hypothetical protein ZEAMMB73_Zm00001d042681 [Zea mays]
MYCNSSCFYYFLIQIVASKTKIYMVLQLVNGGELFDRIIKHEAYGVSVHYLVLTSFFVKF